MNKLVKNAGEYALQTFYQTIDRKANSKKIDEFKLNWDIPDSKSIQSVEDMNMWLIDLYYKSVEELDDNITFSPLNEIKDKVIKGIPYEDILPRDRRYLSSRINEYWKAIDSLRCEVELPARWLSALQNYIFLGEHKDLQLPIGMKVSLQENQLNKPEKIIVEIDANTSVYDYKKHWEVIRLFQNNLPKKFDARRKPYTYIMRDRKAYLLIYRKKLSGKAAVQKLKQSESQTDEINIYDWAKAYKKFLGE